MVGMMGRGQRWVNGTVEGGVEWWKGNVRPLYGGSGSFS